MRQSVTFQNSNAFCDKERAADGTILDEIESGQYPFHEIFNDITGPTHCAKQNVMEAVLFIWLQPKKW